jgi:hypothetical protein
LKSFAIAVNGIVPYSKRQQFHKPFCKKYLDGGFHSSAGVGEYANSNAIQPLPNPNQKPPQRSGCKV